MFVIVTLNSNLNLVKKFVIVNPCSIINNLIQYSYMLIFKRNNQARFIVGLVFVVTGITFVTQNKPIVNSSLLIFLGLVLLVLSFKKNNALK